MCGQGIPGMHGVKPEVSVHGEVTDKSCSCCLWLCRSLALPPTFQLLQLFTAGCSLGTFPRAEQEGGEGAGHGGGGVGVWSDCAPPPGNLGLEPFTPRSGLGTAKPGQSQVPGRDPPSALARRDFPAAETSIFAAHLLLGL